MPKQATLGTANSENSLDALAEHETTEVHVGRHAENRVIIIIMIVIIIIIIVISSIFISNSITSVSITIVIIISVSDPTNRANLKRHCHSPFTQLDHDNCTVEPT